MRTRYDWKEKPWIRIGACLILVAGGIFFARMVGMAANSSFVQTAWTGSPSADVAVDPTNQSGWTKYSAKDASLDISSGTSSVIAYSSAPLTEDTDTDFDDGTLSSTVVSGTGSSAVVTLESTLGDPFVTAPQQWSAGKSTNLPKQEHGTFMVSKIFKIGNYLYCTLNYDYWGRYDCTVADGAEKWEFLARSPSPTGPGADIAYPGSGDYIYVTAGGGTKTFMRYSISGDSWTTLDNTPYFIDTASSLAGTGHGSGRIYCVYGSASTNQDRFGYYDIGTGNWSSNLENTGIVTPAYANNDRLIYTGSGDKIFHFRGNSNDIERFTVSGAAGSWTTLGDGSSISRSYEYGANAVYCDGYIYTWSGTTSRGFWRFNPTTEAWEQLDDNDPRCEMAFYTHGTTYLYYPGSGDYYKFINMGYSFTRPIKLDKTTFYWDLSISMVTDTPDSRGTQAFYPGSGDYIYYRPTRNTPGYFYSYNMTNREWTRLTNMPTGWGEDTPYGAGMAYFNGKIYVISNGSNFGYYEISGSGPSGTWTDLSSASDPPPVSWGGDLVQISHAGEDYLYYNYGADTTTLYRYDINAGGAWQTVSSAIPGTVDDGGGMAYPGAGQYLYCVRGNNTGDFYRFKLATQTWDPDSTLADIPVYMNVGGANAVNVFSIPGQTDYIYYFCPRYDYQYSVIGLLRYKISTDEWEWLNSPDSQYYRNLFAATSTHIYYFGYYNSNQRYVVATDTWEKNGPGLDNPSSIQYGSSIEIGNTIYLFRYNCYGPSSTVFTYDKTTHDYTSAFRIPFTMKAGSNAAYPGTGDLIYVTEGGGDNFWSYNYSTGAWTQLLDCPMPGNWSTYYSELEGYNHSGTLYIFAFFGYGSDTEQIYRYNIASNTWTAAGDLATTPSNYDNNCPGRSLLAMPSKGGLYWVTSNRRSLYLYNVGSDSWSTISNNTIPPDYGSVSNFYYPGSGDYIYYFRTGSSFLKFNMSTSQWTTLAIPGDDTASYCPTIYSSGDIIYVLGTNVGSTHGGGHMLKYSISNDKWDNPLRYIYVNDRNRFSLIADPIYDRVYFAREYRYFYKFDIDTNTLTGLNDNSDNYASVHNVFINPYTYPDTSRYIYVINGGTSDAFRRYHMDANSWEDMDSLPETLINYGGVCAAGTKDYIFAAKGGNSSTFWKYDISANSWANHGYTPSAVYTGSAMCYPGKGNYMYMLRGNHTSDFWALDITVDSPTGTEHFNTSLAQPPFLSGGEYQEYCRYSSAAIYYPGAGDFIYVQRTPHFYQSRYDVDSTRFYRYNFVDDYWEELPSSPMPMRNRPALVRLPSYADHILAVGASYYSENAYKPHTMFYLWKSGTYTSDVIDIGSNEGYSTMTWSDNDGTAPTNDYGEILMQVRTADNSSMSGATAWSVAPFVTKGQDISSLSSVSDAETYIQYKISLYAYDMAKLPEVDTVTINYNAYPTNQSLTSSVYDTGQLRNRLMKLSWTETLPLGTDIRMQLRSSPDNSSWSSWLGPTGTTSVVNNFSTDSDYSRSSKIKVESGYASLMKDLEEYTYKQPVTIDNTGGSAKTNFNAKLIITKANGIFWSRVQSDLDDIRFYDGSNKIGYYLDSYNYSDRTATVYVKVPSIGADTTKTIYLIYGSSNATSESALTNITTAMYQDFYETFDGTTIDAGKFTYGGGNITQDDELAMENNSGDTWDTYIFGSDFISPRVVGMSFTAKVKAQSGTYSMVGWHDSGSGSSYGDLVYALYFNNGGFYIYEDGSGRGTVGSGYTYNTWYEVKFTLKSSGCTYYYRTAGSNNWTQLYDSSYSSATNLRPGIAHRDENEYTWSDDWKVLNPNYIIENTYLTALEESTTSPTLGANWPTREVITLTNSGAELTNYAIEVTLDKGHTAFWAAVQNDGDDIRIVDADNTTVLSHGLTAFDYTNKIARIWVKVPSLPASSSKSIYLYYGNGSASDASDIDTAFSNINNTNILYDGFTGASIDTDKWGGDTGSATVSGGEARINGGGNIDIYSNTWLHTGDVRVISKLRSELSTGDLDAGVSIGFTAFNAAYHGLLDNETASNTAIWRGWDTGSTAIASFNQLLGTTDAQRIELKKLNNDVSFYWEGNGTASATDSTYASGKIAMFNDSDSTSRDVFYDYILAVRDSETQITSTFAYDETANAYDTGDYYADNPTIQPIYGALYANNIDGFQETSTKPAGSEIKYQVSADGYNWYYYNSGWTAVTGGYSQTNTASEINTNIAAFMSTVATEGEFFYRAYLHSDDGSATPQLDQININITSGTSYYQDYTGVAEYINSTHTDVTNDRYFQYKAILYSLGENTPILDDVTLEYVKAYITLTDPTGAEIWGIGSTQYITWSEDGLSDVGGVFDETIKVEYYVDNEEGQRWEVEAASAPNTGSYEWTVDDDHTNVSKVRLTSNGWTAITDESAATFRIVGTVTLTNPTGGERWLIGTTEDVTWTSTSTIPKVKLEYSIDSGSGWNPVIESEEGTPNDGIITNDGTYTWTIPDSATPTSSCLIRVSDSVDSDTESELGTPFRIIGAFNVTYPTLNIPLTSNAQYDVTWTTTGTIDNVDLSYTIDGGTTWRDMAGLIGQVTTIANSSPYQWTVPNTLSDTCLVKVGDGADSSVDDDSVNFYIKGFQVDSPNTALEWETGFSHTISWTSGGVTTPPIRLWLSTDGGSTYPTLISSRQTDTGSYAWTIGNYVSGDAYTTSDTCKVRVIDDESRADTSDVNFRIMPNPAITVTAPTGSDQWMVGTDHDVTWTTTGNVSSDLAIEYSVDDGGWTAVSPAPTADDITNKTYSWTAVDSMSTNVKIKVYETTIPTNTDSSARDTQTYTSDESDPFEISSPTVTITAPTSGTIWVVGDTSRDITWSKVGTLIDDLTIEYSTDYDGVNPESAIWNNIDTFSQAVYDGSYSWTDIPALAAGSSVYVRIYDSRDPTIVTDISDAIEILAHQRIILLTPMTEGELLIQGDSYDLTWSWDGQATTDTLVLKLSDDGGETWPVVPPYNIGDQIANTPTTYSWGIPSTLETTTAKIRIYDANDALVESFSPIFTISVPTIDVTAPTALSQWYATGTYDITWAPVGSVNNDDLKIEYSLDGGSWETITASTTTSEGIARAKSWQVPDSADSTCRIQITDNQRSVVTAISGEFNIITPTITVTAPTGSETGANAWVVGTDHDISWTTTGGAEEAIAQLKIRYSTDGSNYTTITDITDSGVLQSDSGSYSWTIPEAESDTVTVKIYDTNRGATTDTSNEFEIAPPSITITAANGGESWIIGTEHEVTWYSVGTITEPLVLSYTPDGSNWNTVSAFDGDNDDSYMWTVPDDYAAGTAKIKFVDDSSPTARSDESDASFTISLPTISVDTPGVLWSATDTKAITWSSVGTLIGPLKVEWSINNFVDTNIISSTVDKDDTSLDWEIPVGAISATVRTKVTDLGRSLTWDKTDNFTVLPIPVITVSSPDTSDTGEDAWRIGKEYTITWSDNGGAISNNLKLQYSVNGGSDWTDIATAETNDGSYDWTVPLAASASDSSLIKVYDNVEWKSATNCEDDSEAFEIAIPRITITSPAGSEYWAVGDSSPITWTSDGYIFDDLTIQYSLDGGTFYYPITSGEENDESYTWTVPDVTSSDAVIKIIDASSNYGGEQVIATSSSFNIIEDPTITVTAPDDGTEVYVLGDTLPFTWTYQGLQVENVKIEISSDDFVSAIQTAIESTPNDGSQGWTIPDTALSGSTIKARISMVGNSSVNDVSDNPFRIRGGFTMTAPALDQRCIVGKAETATWTTRGTIANVKVKYSSDGGTNWTTIIASTSNEETYDLTIPAPRVSDLAMVRIEDASDDTVYAESELFDADYYTITWRVVDYDTNAPLKQLSVSDTVWVDATNTLEAPVDHDYPYALYTTFWSKDGYIERATEWIANSDKTLTVPLENQLTAMVEWHVLMSTSYNASTDTLSASAWLERRGKLIGVVETDLVDLQYGTIEVYDGDTLVNSITDNSCDAQGAFSFNWATTGLESGKSYFVKAIISYRDSIYTSGSSIDVTRAKAIQETRSMIASEALKTTAIKTAVETDIPTKITAAKVSIKADTASILTDTGTTIPAVINDTKAKVTTFMKTAILNKQSSVRKAEKLKVRYRSHSGLGTVKLNVYDPENKIKATDLVMEEIGTTGIYEKEITFKETWGTGDFTLVCSDETHGTMDALTLTVFESDFDSISGNVAAIMGTTSGISDIGDVADTLTSQFSVIEKSLASVGKGLVDDVQGAVEIATEMESVFSELSKVSKAIKSMETTTKDMNLDKFYNLETEKKQDMRYLKNKTNELRAMMDVNQKMIDNVANEPVVQTWFEYRSVVLRALIINPSESQKKVVPFRAYLPKEARPEHLLSRGDLKVSYDTQQGSYYVHANITLAPKETKEIEIEMKDIWQIKPLEIESLRVEAKKVHNMLQGTEFNDRAKFLLMSIEENLDSVVEKQKIKPVNPEDHISKFRENLSLMQEAKADLTLARSLLSQTKPFSLQATWKLILSIIVFLGILSLGFYVVWQKQIKLGELPTIEGEEEKAAEKPENKTASKPEIKPEVKQAENKTETKPPPKEKK